MARQMPTITASAASGKRWAGGEREDVADAESATWGTLGAASELEEYGREASRTRSESEAEEGAGSAPGSASSALEDRERATDGAASSTGPDAVRAALKASISALASAASRLPDAGSIVI